MKYQLYHERSVIIDHNAHLHYRLNGIRRSIFDYNAALLPMSAQTVLSWTGEKMLIPNS